MSNANSNWQCGNTDSHLHTYLRPRGSFVRGDQTLSKADAAMQLLLKGEEDDFQPIEPGELVAPKVNVRLLKHLMN